MWAILMASALPAYLAPMVDPFSGKPCATPTIGRVNDGTIEYSAEQMINMTPNIEERCHARRLALASAYLAKRRPERRR